MNARVLKNSMMTINRDNFFKIGDNNIIQLFDSVTRSIVLKNKQKYANDTTTDGITAIKNLTYDIDGDMINIKTFTATDEYSPDDVVKHDFLNEERKSMFSFRQGLKIVISVVKLNTTRFCSTRIKRTNTTSTISIRSYCKNH